MKKIIFFAAIFLTSQLNANIILHNTRVIFNDDQKEKTLRLHNNNPHPVLVQTWVDDGIQQQIGTPPKTPFTILPPIFRMETQQGHILRIIYNGQTLPKDRESVYWVNVFEVPPKDADLKDKNTLQIAFRTRIKLFFRPTNLAVPTTDQLADKIECKLSNYKNLTETATLSCKNYSPYYISFSKISIIENKKDIPLSLDDVGMLAPFESSKTKIKLHKTDGHYVNTMIINDLGGVEEKIIKVIYE